MQRPIGLAPSAAGCKPNVIIALLAERFPCTFTTELAKVRPLAIGIFQTLQLFCPDIPPRELRSALRAYTSHGTYLRSLVEGTARIDLDGAPSGAVTADAARHAAGKLAERETAAHRRAAEAKAAFAAKTGPALAPARRTPPPASTAGPRRLGLADLRAAALARRAEGGR